MIEITYLKGDATDPTEVNGRKIIIHVCNTEVKWGKGFVLAVSKKWKAPEEEYRKQKSSTVLGEVQFIKVESDIAVANMIAQEMGWKNGVPPLRYEALDTCLQKVADTAKHYKASIVGPRFGSALAGGKWEEIEKLIVKNLCEQDIPVYIYDL